MEESKLKKFEEMKSAQMEVLYRQAEKECEEIQNKQGTCTCTDVTGFSCVQCMFNFFRIHVHVHLFDICL